jgi:hypothetical protein
MMMENENVPKGRVVTAWNIVTKYLLERMYAFGKNPSGRFLCFRESVGGEFWVITPSLPFPNADEHGIWGR